MVLARLRALIHGLFPVSIRFFTSGRNGVSPLKGIDTRIQETLALGQSL